LLPWIVLTFQEIGKRRIGLQGKRGQCQLTTVESLPAHQSQSPQTIYTAETEMLADDGLILRLDDVMQAAPHNTNEIELEFLTPTSVKVNGRWTSNLTFEHLIRNLLRRTRFLSYFHCGEDLDVDAHGLIETSTTVTHNSRLNWIRKDRYSYRAEKSVPMGGFIGKIRFSGELEQFLPFIYLGEYLHIGHHTAFGFGQYRIISTSI
ncbi:MAG: CRISPR system precrRNA processing endoribonuclease RAMP protein Cas6, partial [Candidatus Poribacteria bacterium]|nr:CRISPR system precrRNA processing endoribonuclease RAMP protein Cas6 [Candidatus Poribacteria bacterium]